jgi:hypothetical protein
MFCGVIIEESLVDTSVLKDVRIVKTDISQVTEKHQTPWVTQWTLDTVEIPDSEIEGLTARIAAAIDREHAHAWYADFKNDSTHYIVFLGRVFKVDRSRKEEYKSVIEFGLALGIPGHQLKALHE